MERKYRKAINFDLSVHELEKYQTIEKPIMM